MRRHRLTTTLLLLCTGLTAATVATAAEYGGVRELYLAPTISYFQWEERAGGARLLREDGPLFGIAGGIGMELLRTESGQALSLSGAAQLYGGIVTYDGHTQSDSNLPGYDPKYDNRPLATDVDYVGGHVGFDLGWLMPLRRSRFGPLAGIDYRAWSRHLQGGTALDANGAPFTVGDTTEFWQNATLRLGFRWDEIPLGGEWRLFGEGCAVYPFFTANQTDVPIYGTTTLKPEGEWSARGELGVRSEKFRFAVSYEGLRFGSSSPVNGYYQPASNGDFVGFSVGYYFR